MLNSVPDIEKIFKRLRQRAVARFTIINFLQRILFKYLKKHLSSHSGFRYIFRWDNYYFPVTGSFISPA